MKIPTMRTRIRIQYQIKTKARGALKDNVVWVDLGNLSVEENPRYKYCSWKNLFGDELIQSGLEVAKNPSKIFIRIDNRINSTMRVIKDNDITSPYEIVSNIEINDENQLMIFKVQRMEGA